MPKTAEEMTDAELIEAAKTEAEAPPEPKVETKPVAEPVEQEEEPETQVFRRVIDIGGGAGPEVFEADSLEELVDKIAEAKGNATRKIREQEDELRERRAKDVIEPKQPSAEEEAIYSQELMKAPTQAFKKMFRELTG